MSCTAAALERLHRFNTWFHGTGLPAIARPAIQGVRISGYLSDESGWGAAGRGYVSALEELGCPLALNDVSALTGNRSGDRSVARRMTAVDTDINLVCVDAGQHFALLAEVGESFFAGHFNIGAWFWELQHFPDAWYNRFAYYDEIWVATSFVAAALAPVAPVPVIRIPPVIAPLPGCRERGRRRLGVHQHEFVFLFVFDVHSHLPRKNPAAAIAAFRRAFPNRTDVRLVLKSVNAGADPEGYAALRDLAAGAPIEFHDGYWDADDVRDLFAACDAYVSLHRSEGTGLTIAEAMAAGKPVVATDWSGNTDFADASNSYPVAYELTTVARTVGPYRAGEIWAEPDVTHAAAQMSAVVADPAAAAARGEAARRRIQRDYGRQAIAELIRARLDVIASRDLLTTLRCEVSAFVDGYRDLIGDIRAIAARVVPPHAVIAVVSRGDEALLALEGRAAWHFPEARPGVYAGYHPADSEAAVTALEAARLRGAEFLLLPGTAYWWLEHYGGFRDHLDTRYRCTWRDSCCAIYDLGQRSVDGPA